MSVTWDRCEECGGWGRVAIAGSRYRKQDCDGCDGQGGGFHGPCAAVEVAWRLYWDGSFENPFGPSPEESERLCELAVLLTDN